MKLYSILLLFFLPGILLSAQQKVATDTRTSYYISPTGDDLEAGGTLENPWRSLSRAIQNVDAGDTIFCRGGSYDYSQTVLLESSGEAGNRICIFAYRDDSGQWEEPVFDFANQEYGSSNRAIKITGNYWYFFGIHITHAGDNGIKVEGNGNIIERCVFSYNGDTGIQLGFGHDFSDSHPGISSNNGSYCMNNLVVDCDSYQNYDPDSRGGDADGFACKMHNGLQNWFLRCRAWNNSDDAWDMYETDYPVYIIECWAWHSGDATQHPVEGGSFQGNGNGIKMGGNGSGGSSKGKHEAWNCVAFNNNKTSSVKGFDQNSHKGGVKIVNCLSYNNGYDYMFEDSPSGTTNDFYNNICLSKRIEINPSGAVMQHNVHMENPEDGWKNALSLSFSDSDFSALDEESAKEARDTDGRLPKSFAHLLEFSELIDVGLDNHVVPLPAFVDQPLIGNAMDLSQEIQGGARDLGPYESPYGDPLVPGDTTAVEQYINHEQLKASFCNDELIVFLPTGMKNSKADFKLVNISGQVIFQMTSLEIEGSSRLTLPVPDLEKGIYILIVGSGEKKLITQVLQ